MKRIAVYCGSSVGAKSIYKEEATILGRAMAAQGIELVFGGSKNGLMGAIANGILDAGGSAIGIMPEFMKDKELAHQSLTELIFVNDMHERKAKMEKLSDGIIAMPGGFGTLDELFEILTWAQLDIHNKPVGLLNVEGFYNPLLTMVKSMVENGFVWQRSEDRLIQNANAQGLLGEMFAFEG